MGARTVVLASLAVALAVGLIAGPSGAAGNTVPLPGVVDLVVDHPAQPNPTSPGATVQLESVISNEGTLVAEQVEVAFEIPGAGLSVDAGELCTAVGSTRLESDGSSGDEPWTVTCDLGTLPPGTRTGISLLVTAGVPGTHVAKATVSSMTPEGRPSDNEVVILIRVLPATSGAVPAFQQPGRFNPSSRATV